MSGASVLLKDIRFAYGETAMQFDLDLAAGSFLAVIGPSGSGKSTLLNLIAGFEQPSTGIIRIGDADVTRTLPADRPVSMIFQDNNLFAHLDSATNVALGLSPTLKLTTADRDRVSEALARVGLQGFEKRLPPDMSGGQRQRVALARALVRDKPVLLLDEPFAALGPALHAEMLAMIHDLQRETGATALLVTHNPGDARSAASHTAFIEDGEISLFGETAEVFAGNHSGLRHYLGDV